MAAAAPWSVKGINPKAREVAKDLARRSGMTLGEWLNHVILEDDIPEEVTSEDHFGERGRPSLSEPPRPRIVSSLPTPRLDELGRIAFALDRLTDRIEASETRTGLAISGVEHSVRQAVARIETAEREQLVVVNRFEGAVDRVADEQSRLADRLRRMESDVAGPRSVEALRALEQSISRVTSQAVDTDDRTREQMAALQARLQRAEALAQSDPGVLIEEVVGRLGQRLADAETRTTEALVGLQGSLVDLDRRLNAFEGTERADLDRRLEALAGDLIQRVDAARADIAEKLKASTHGQMEARLGEMGAHVAASERRSAQAIDRMGREVLMLAEAINRRVQSAEQRSAEAIEQVGGEVARIAGAVEDRLGRTEQVHAEALERLGGEIGRITERLTERMVGSERRAAQAIDDVGVQVARITERMEERHERASEDLAEKIRQSEERTARLLADGWIKIEPMPQPATKPAAAAPEPVAEAEPEDAKTIAATGPAPAAIYQGAPMDPMSAVMGQPVQPAPEPIRAPESAAAVPPPVASVANFDASDGFIPIPEPEDLYDFDQPDPPESGHEMSTREVIAQARAAARAAGETPPKLHAKSKMQAKMGWRVPVRPGINKNRSLHTSTLQTAFLVAGGAAFLSVGAAGVVLMEGPGKRPQAAAVAPAEATAPRAALALAPQAVTPPAAAPPLAPATPVPAAGAAEVITPAQPKTSAANYAAVVSAVESRIPGALARLRALADAGDAQAQFFLAKAYEGGQYGVAVNMSEARRWTARAAEGGDRSAMHNLALYFFSGDGGPKDVPAAARWFRRAAERGVVDSQYNLGLLYQSGSGVDRDYAQAYRWFSIAANGGDAGARAAAVEVESKLSAAKVAEMNKQVAAYRAAPSVVAQAAAPQTASLAAAQRILGRLGYYKGPADGAGSSALKAAVAAYQKDQKLAATGTLDPVTMSRLSVYTR